MVSYPIPSALLPKGGNGVTDTVPRAVGIALWPAITLVAGCVIGIEPITAALDSSTQLVTLVIVLILVLRTSAPPRTA
ncbi:hypothetical protein [Streptomyces sp. NPDC006012]|uniref:hypothetical protein n=1 Tax=Streptomyces sp. NPDC006012 TaxID=3364739 RepID=UPI00368B3185